MVNTSKRPSQHPGIKTPRNRRVLGFVASLLFVAGVGFAQPIARPFPFTLRTTDTLQTTMLSGLLPEAGPAGKHGAFHLSPEGHFVAQDGTRIKFFGTEVQWSANFLAADEAEILAKRLHKMGFNALRLNFYDYHGWEPTSLFSVFDTAGQYVTNSYTINQLHLRQFDTLLYTLKRAGIYVFLPVRSIHPFRAGDNVPTFDSMYYHGYLAGMLYPEAQQLQHNWARALLTHVNPLTGLALGNDPSIACYEISFEESLHWYWQLERLNYTDANNFAGNSTISYHQSRRFDTLFNNYLQRKYGTDAAINAAWSGSGGINSTNLLANGSFENFDNANWNIASNSPARASAILSNPGFDASPAMLIHIAKIDTGYRGDGVAFYNASASAKLASDKRYQFSFRAKLSHNAQSPALTRPIAVIVNDANNQSNLLAGTILDTTWREYKFSFRAIYGGPQIAGVVLSSDSGNVLFDAFALKEASEEGLRPGETLAGAKVKRLVRDTMTAVSLLRARDLTMFYDSLERNYYNSMERLLRDTLHAAGLVNTTQGGYWSIPLDYRSTSNTEVTEMHTGWDYLSQRPDRAYTDSTWMVRNYAMVTDAGFYALGLSAASSIAGKAHVIGQWTVPTPNQHASEQAIIPVVYGCYQDWDGMFFTPYSVFHEQLFADTLIGRIDSSSSGNNINANHALMAHMPMASYVFRNNLVPPAEVFDTIHHDVNDVLDLPHYGYRGPFGQPMFQYGDQAIMTSLGVRQKYDTKKSDSSFENIFAHSYDEMEYPNQDFSKTSKIVFNPTAGTFQANEPHVYTYTGIATDSVVFPRMTMKRTDAGGDQLSMYYLFDVDSGFGLLSLTTRTQNSGVKWIDTMGFGKNWGHAPTVMSAATIQLNLQGSKDSILIAPLDAFGNPTGQMIRATHIPSTDRFTATIDQSQTHAAWYLLVEKASAPDAGVADESAGPTLSLEVSPNPATSRINVSLASNEAVKLSLVDDLGREVHVAQAYKLVQTAGKRTIDLDITDLPSGHYILLARTSTATKATNVTVVR
jgi:hypothetical protein